MHRKDHVMAIVLAAAVGVLAACGSDPDPEVTPTSAKATVRFKNGQRLQRELERALAIDGRELCKELGQYECFNIHGVVLGNAEAFGVGLYKPLPSTTATSPLAAERVILAACTQRADADLGDPASALIFKNLAVDGDGRLEDADAPAVGEAIDMMYRQALSRRAKDSEIEHHRQLYRDIEARGIGDAPTRDWAALSCFAVLTSLESLFY